MATIGVKVELEGAQTYKQNMSQLTSETKLYQAEVKKLETEMKNGNTSFSKRKELSEALNNQLKAQKEQEAVLSAEIERVSQAEGENSQHALKLKTQYENLQTAISNTEQAIKKNGNSLDIVGSKFIEVGQKIEAAGQKISEFGASYTKKISAPLAAVGVASVKTSADFDSAMSQVAATMGYTVDELHDDTSDASKNMETLSNFAQEMGATTSFSASEAAQALNYMALAGYDTEKSMQMLPTVLNLAAAGGIDLAYASDMVTDAQSALGLSTEETTTMVDQMATTASKSNTSVEQLGEAMLTIGATARSVKGGTQELSTMLGVLADNGIKGSEGGTHLRNVLMSLQTPTDDGAAALANLGIEVYDAEGNMRSMIDIIGDFQTSMEGMTDAEKTDAISQIFNKTDIASVNALLNTSSARFEELSGAIGDATGSAQAMADVQLDNFNGQITLLKSALEGAAIAIGEKLTPYVSALVEKVQGAVDWFNSLSDSQQDLIVKIGLVVAAIGPALLIVGKIVSVVGSITSAIGSFITFIPTLTAALSAVGAVITGTVIPAIVSVVTAIAPFLLIGAAIAAVIAGIILVVKNWGAITEWISQKWQEFCNFIMPVLQSIGDFFASIFEKIKEDITTRWTLIKNFTTLLWNAIKSFITNTLNGIKTTFANIFNTVKTTVTNVFNNIKNAISTKLTEAVNTVKTKLSNIKDSFLNLKDSALTWGKDMIDNFINGIKSKFNAVKDTITDLASSIKDIIGFSEPKTGPLSRFHTFAPDMMDLFMEGIRENEKALQAQVATTFGGAFTPTDNITVTTNNSEVLNMLSEVLNVLPSLANSQIVLDSGVLVGETAPQMNQALGQLYINEQRRV